MHVAHVLRFTSLRSRSDHARTNRELVRLFRAQPTKRLKLRFREGVIPTLYLPDHGIWLAAHTLANRYRNALGPGDPTGRSNVWPSVQLNLALEPGSSRPHARFLRDANDQLWIGHSGQLGGRVAGIRRDDFLRYVGGARDVAIDGEPEQLLLLGTFAKPSELLAQIAKLTHAASTYRGAAAVGLSI